MEEVMMIPTQEFERLQDYYKGQITQSALLNKAGRLAAEQHLIAKNPKIPASKAVRMMKPLAREQQRLTKRIRTGGAPTVGVSTADPDEAMVDSPLENLLKKILKKETPTPRPPIPPRPTIKKQPPSTVKKGPTPSTSGYKPPPAPKRKSLSEPAKKYLRQLGVDKRFIDDDEGGYSPKGFKGKKPKKARKTALQKLQEGWENWDDPLRRDLDYETD